MKKLILLSILGLAGGAALYGHASVQSKDNLDGFTGRSYEEGTTAIISLTVPHGCSDSEGNELTTKHVTVLFPNAADLSGVTYTQDSSGKRYAGNALMGTKPRYTRNWRYTRLKKGTVPEFYSHGAKTEDLRAIHWKYGRLRPGFYESLDFRASLPKLDGCVSKLKVFLPMVQYCSRGHRKAWIREATNAFPEDVISKGYAPYFEILRNEEKNPLPAGCGEDESREVYPSSGDIDAFLTLRR